MTPESTKQTSSDRGDRFNSPEERLICALSDLRLHTSRAGRGFEYATVRVGAARYRDPVLLEFIEFMKTNLLRWWHSVVRMQEARKDQDLAAVQRHVDEVRHDATAAEAKCVDFWGRQCQQRNGVKKTPFVKDLFMYCDLVHEFAELRDIGDLVRICLTENELGRSV